MIFFFALALVALLCVLAPALIRRPVSEQSGDRTGDQDPSQNYGRAWYQDRLQELAKEDIDASDRSELADELAAVLLAEYPEDASQADAAPLPAEEPARVRPGNVLLMLGTVLVLLAGGVYLQIGSFGASSIQGAQVVLSLAPEQASDELRVWQGRLGAWLQEQPEDAQSWYLLGHAHLKLGEFAQASQAFAQAHEFANGDVSVKFYWLQARYLERQGVLDETSRQLAEEILAADPNNPQVLEMLAVAAISQGDSAEAITLLNLTLNSEQRPDRIKATVDAIRALRSAYASQTDSPGINVRVEPGSSQSTQPEGVVFVVARPIGGGMPYAVVRRPSWLLPFAVTLDDLVSMSGERLLSQAEDFEVLVRVSTNGLAQGEAGDWQWFSGPLSLGAGGESKTLVVTLTPTAAAGS